MSKQNRLASFCLLVTFLAASPLASADFAKFEELSIPADALANGYFVWLRPGTIGHRLISVPQNDADVTLRVINANRQQWIFDAPGRRAGPERACVFDDGRGLTLEVRGPAAGAHSTKSIRVLVREVPGNGNIARGSELDAECLESRAAVTSGHNPERAPTARATGYELAARIWESRGDLARAAMARLQSGWMLARRTRDNVTALERGTKARETFESAHDTLGAALATLQMTVPRTELIKAGLDAKGHEASDKAAMPEALHRDLQTALATFDAAGVPYFGAMARMQLANSFYLRDDIEAAIRVLDEAVERYKLAGSPDGLARALANRCYMLFQSGQYRVAADEFDAVLDSDDTQAFPEVTSDILDNSATTQAAAGNYDKALSQYVKALSIHQSVKDAAGMARSLNGLASTYLSLGNPSAAIDYTQRAQVQLPERDASGQLSAEPARLASLLIAGDAHRQMGDLPAAEVAHRSVLALANSDLAAARVRLELARDLIEQRDSKRAIETLNAIAPKETSAWSSLSRQIRLRRSQALLAAGLPAQAIAELTPLRGEFTKSGAPELELEVLETLGRAQLASAKVQAALQTSDLGLAQLKALRLASGNPEMRARLNDVYRSTYALRVEALQAMRSQEQNADARQRLEAQLFAAADEARAGLARATPAARSLVPQESSTERSRLAAEIALRQKILSGLEAEDSSNERTAAVRIELAGLRAEFDAAAPGQDSPLPIYEESDYSANALRSDTAILMFLNSAGKLHRYVIVRGSIRELEAIPVEVVTENVQRAFKVLSAPVYEARADEAIPPLRALSSLLMPAAAMIEGHGHIIVVGDNITARIPFAALTLNATAYTPLIAAHDVTMALTLRDALSIGKLADRARQIDLSDIALFSDPVFTTRDERVTTQSQSSGDVLSLTRLSGTAGEAKGIENALPGKKVSAYSGFDAKRETLLSDKVDRATVLHLATHAVANDRWPNGSGLMLSALDPEGEVINGYVSTLDLLSRRSSTDLVVLSACETARGESGASESVAGLARAVLGGGARRVVASHWDVDDVAPAPIMKEFYTRLAAGDSAARALGAAQRTVSATRKLRDPALWAAFVLYERAPQD